MRTRTLVLTLTATLGVGLLSLASSPAVAASDNGAHTIDCHMNFKLNGWSAIYERATGSGTVKCSDGQSMHVTIDAHGGGLTVGKYKINDGKGDFTGVTSINDVLGSYAEASAHAGVVKSSRAAAMTKGTVSLALSGTGNGWDIGAGFAGFTIKKAR
ncbi:MAG: hypothetical protein ACREPU_04320 [Rhodanobacteraceae bacterium]